MSIWAPTNGVICFACRCADFHSENQEYYVEYKNVDNLCYMFYSNIIENFNEVLKSRIWKIGWLNAIEEHRVLKEFKCSFRGSLFYPSPNKKSTCDSDGNTMVASSRFPKGTCATCKFYSKCKSIKRRGEKAKITVIYDPPKGSLELIKIKRNALKYGRLAKSIKSSK